ncbi:N/A [soil metagenome]|nr:amino acid adenylation domain-containing protein [Gemmatimonadota bacterium]
MSGPHRLHLLLEESARRGAGRIAVEDAQADAAATYGELNALADGLCELLIRQGVRPGDRVGICAPKSIGTVAAIFGILKAGAAYVPVDAGAPPQRNAFILGDCSVRAVVAERGLVEGLRAAGDAGPLPLREEIGVVGAYGADLLLLAGQDAEGDPGVEGTGATAAPAGLSYILYTSGSTGRPKGVMHTHASALSFVDWCSDTFEPTSADRFSSHAPFHFDLSILDLYVPLKHGGTLVLIGEEAGKQPQGLAALIAERRLTVWYSTPSLLRLLLEFGRIERYDYSALRLVLFAGEVFPVKHLRALQALWPHPRYFNLYGPTETNVCTYYEIPSVIPEERTEPLPIGRTCENDRARVIDAQERQPPPGGEGELYIAGGSVMQGYWNLPERNDQAFFRDSDGTRWYRTGDLVREASDRSYIFLGRKDRMVKRRGYRVELGEIEAALYRHPAVREAAVVALPDEENGVLIRAYLSTTAEGEPPSLIELKRFCAQNLPLYMVPDRFSFQASLPKTSTDKIDYQTLKERV